MAILEAEGYDYKVLEQLDQALRLEADEKCVEAIKRRAALTRVCGLELFNCKAEKDEIFKAVNSSSLDQIFENGETFVVRVRRVKEYASDINSMTLEQKLGELVLSKAPETKVKLKNPDKTLVGILTGGKFIFGVKLAEISPTPFVQRRPRKKPFFHPSAMPPKLARCMVNLTKPNAGDLLFDAFCGTGGMLIEAALIGCRVVGVDVQKRMVRGTRKNLHFFQINSEGVIVADSRNPPLTRVDCVVTDPPYGRSASTFKRSTKQIVEDVLTAVHSILREEGRICMATPRTLNITGICPALGYKCVESHFVYVHRSLTREIAVLEKE
jgi:tRNA (guanine10-N2)-dimethyltransferase